MNKIINQIINMNIKIQLNYIILVCLFIPVKTSPDIEPQCKQWKINNYTILTNTKVSNIQIFVDAQDQLISKQIRQKGIHNQLLIQLLCFYIQEGLDIVHVGTHVGLQTLAMAKQISQKNYQNVKIHAFQPNELYYILLTKSAYINNLQKYILTYKAAVYSNQGQAQLAIKNTDTSGAQILPNAKTQRKSDYKYNVKTVSLDKVLNNKLGDNNPQIGLVYISANTMEIQVMMGMKQIIERNNNKLVVIFDWSFGRNVHKNVDGLINVFYVFQKYKYKLFQIQQVMQSKLKFKQVNKFMELIKIKQGKFIFLPVQRSLHQTQ